MELLDAVGPSGNPSRHSQLQQAGAWNDGNLVRWYEQSLQPVKGWRRRSLTAMDGICRKLLSYVDNSSNRRTVAGTNTKLYAIQESGQVHDITPTSFTTGQVSTPVNIGYGGGTWGKFEWGTPRQDLATYDVADTWSLDTWVST